MVIYLDLQIGSHGDVLTCGQFMTPVFASWPVYRLFWPFLQDLNRSSQRADFLYNPHPGAAFNDSSFAQHPTPVAWKRALKIDTKGLALTCTSSAQSEPNISASTTVSFLQKTLPPPLPGSGALESGSGRAMERDQISALHAIYMPFDPLKHIAACRRGTDRHAFASMWRVYPLHTVRGWEAAYLPIPFTSD